MADEVHYVSDSNKRKYDDNQTPPPPRRQTGFSAPISSQSPPDSSLSHQATSYNNVPPPMDEIQLAKQKAQEIAARLFNNAEATKRPRVENGGNSGFDSMEPVTQKPLGLSSASSIPSSYGGYPGPSKKIEIPNGRVGVIIGKGGETIKYLQIQSGAKIQVTRDMDADPHSQSRGVELMGTPEQISKAEQLIKDVLNEAEAGGSGIVSRRVAGQPAGADQFVMKVPNNKVGLVIGKGGETIKNMQARTGARIQVIPLHLPPGDTSMERTLQIDGTTDQIEAAKQLVNEVISENRVRNPAMSGGYSQQGYQARPPTNWAPPGAPMQQPGYGYVQPGAYPGSAPQYNMNQQPYPGYPPQTASGGYASGWDQTNATSNQQTAQGGGGYDYYGQHQASQQQQQQQQQQVPGAATDTAAYGYNQPTSGYSQGQGYAQDGYGGYHAPSSQSGYGQSQPNTLGYDQQQGYNSTSGYANPPTEGHTPSYGTQADASQAPPVHSSSMAQQGYAAGQQPSPNTANYPQGPAQPGYGVPPTSQAGYGAQQQTGYGSSYGPPQTQKPPATQQAYGQSQQSPTALGGGYGQHGYPPTQSGYAQPESGAQRPPSAGYGTPTSQPGYGVAGYGAPPAASSQSNYGQQQAAPPYGSAYSGGYSQPPAAYSSEAAPASQASQPSGVSKASPQS